MTIYCCYSNLKGSSGRDKACSCVPKCPPNNCRLSRTDIFTRFVRDVRYLFGIERDEDPRRTDDESVASSVYEAKGNRGGFNIHNDTKHQQNNENSDIRSTRSRGGSKDSTFGVVEETSFRGNVKSSGSENRGNFSSGRTKAINRDDFNFNRHKNTNPRKIKENSDIKVVYTTRSRGGNKLSTFGVVKETNSQGNLKSSEKQEPSSSGIRNVIRWNEVKAEVNPVFEQENYDSGNVSLL